MLKKLLITLMVICVCGVVFGASMKSFWNVSTSTQTIIRGTETIIEVNLINATTIPLIIDLTSNRSTPMVYKRVYVPKETNVCVPMYEQNIVNFGVNISSHTPNLTGVVITNKVGGDVIYR